jgi:hypothetical protein
LPSRGRYFSSSFSSRISKPPVAQLMVVSCVPMATRMVSALALADGRHGKGQAEQGFDDVFHGESPVIYRALISASR